MEAPSWLNFVQPSGKGKEIMVTCNLTLKDLHGSERSHFSPLIGKANYEATIQCSVVR